MDPFGGIKGTHKVITLQVQGRQLMKILCLVQEDADGGEAYYVLAECEGRPLKWKSMIKDNSIRRLREEFVGNIVAEEEVDQLDVETIFFCTTEASKA